MPRAMSPSIPTLASTSLQWSGIDTMPASPTPMHDTIGSGKKKRGGLGKIFNIFTGGKGKHEPVPATKRSFDDGTTDSVDQLCRVQWQRRTTSTHRSRRRRR